jgi:hypothetical protein
MLKNTFLHVDRAAADDLELDDSECFYRRQLSEPAPMKRQISKIKARTLGSCEENDAEKNDVDTSDTCDISDIYDTVDANGFVRQLSCFQGQTSSDLEPPETSASWERQLSSFGSTGFDKQTSFDRQTSSFGFTRQETEQFWPTYATSKECLYIGRDNAQNRDDQEHGDLAPQMPKPGFEIPLAGYTAEICQGDAKAGASGDGAAKAGTAKPRNRRKARSLITLAQEAQKKQQRELAKNQFSKQQMNQHNADSSSASPVQESPSKKSGNKFCPYCGGSASPHFKFCQYCGKNLAAIWGN